MREKGNEESMGEKKKKIKQQKLIKQLQEQHYEQYMAQVYAQQTQSQAEMLEASNGRNSDNSDSESGPKPAESYLQEGLERPKDKVEDDDGEDSEASENEIVQETEQLPSIHGQMGLFCHSNPQIDPASLWNSKGIEEFKNNIKKEGPEGIIKVGHGETVTVRVPTHAEGTHLYWEFCTDYYDIGFGVYFEWTVAESNQVTVHVSESDDEEDYDEEAEAIAAAASTPNDVESGAPATAAPKPRDPNKPRIDEVIPVYRRECHEEVYAGSHKYPGQGVYLLKFDNSYSLWRSKTLYYRVFYSK
ncbi:unnamed protein product [Bursaphelenchus okinawaensis]|uniref:GOLD domain-containing protein n=1 Tax=Bursaphelenchus okinawaensis TaxID=465554 RepID=A0A811L9A7_9BILA|nr:unnamed protein product [Bursaphelenchus okinawaensis]CAG9121429.1 unnamed protein product [Bursaphelenchus okinawaensis]